MIERCGDTQCKCCTGCVRYTCVSVLQRFDIAAGGAAGFIDDARKQFIYKLK